jgi:hypothetical protein
MTDLKALEQKHKELGEEIEKLKKGGEEWPKKGNSYYYVPGSGNPYGTFYGTHNTADRGRIERGNAFRTEPEAWHYSDFLKVTAKLRRAAKGFVPDWSDEEQRKHYIWYNARTKQLNICYNRMTCHFGIMYFRTEQDAQDALDSLSDAEKETLKKGWPV